MITQQCTKKRTIVNKKDEENVGKKINATKHQLADPVTIQKKARTVLLELDMEEL